MSGDRIFLQLKHFAGPPTVAPQAAKVAQCDDEGRLLVAATVTPLPPEPAPPPTSTVVDYDVIADNLIPTPCRLYQARASNDTAWGMFLVLCDMATEPGDDDEAVWSMFVPAGESVGEVFTSPLSLAVGLSFAWSLKPKYIALPPVFSGCSVSVATFT